MATPTERLSRSHDEPSREAAAAAPGKKAGSMWPWYLLLLLLIAGVGAGAWWLSTGQEAPPPELPAEQSLPIPVTSSTAVEPSANDPAAASDEASSAENASVLQPAPPLAQTSARSTERKSAAPVLEPTSGYERRAKRTTKQVDQPAAAPALPGPIPAITYNPRPYGGRVVQLGAFPTRAQAEDGWKRITRRYPYLKTKAKMVNTVDVQGLGGGRPMRMYRLQLGTSSQAQSVVICQQLERAGHSCVVVY